MKLYRIADNHWVNLHHITSLKVKLMEGHSYLVINFTGKESDISIKCSGYSEAETRLNSIKAAMEKA